MKPIIKKHDIGTLITFIKKDALRIKDVPSKSHWNSFSKNVRSFKAHREFYTKEPKVISSLAFWAGFIKYEDDELWQILEEEA